MPIERGRPVDFCGAKPDDDALRASTFDPIVALREKPAIPPLCALDAGLV